MYKLYSTVSNLRLESSLAPILSSEGIIIMKNDNRKDRWRRETKRKKKVVDHTKTREPDWLKKPDKDRFS